MLTLTELLVFLVDVVVALVGGACLLRLYMQYQRIPFGNPIGRFVFALTDWIILPLRKVLPSIRRIDTASLLAAFLLVLVECLVIHLLLAGTRLLHLVPVVALFGLVRVAIYGLTGLVIAYAVLSWVNPDSPVYDLIDKLCAPVLRPFRRLIPLVGGVDLSPLAVIVLLQVGAIILGNVMGSVFTLGR